MRVKRRVVVVGIISNEVIINVSINFIVILIVNVVISINNNFIRCNFILLINVRFGFIVIDSKLRYC